MSVIDQLANHFNKFPGIGPRQARRFVYFLLSSDDFFIKNFFESVSSIRKDINQCNLCYRYFENKHQIKKQESIICDTCNDPTLDASLLLILEKDSDFENICKCSVYNGHYFVLGGLIPIAKKRAGDNMRSLELLKTVEKKLQGDNLREIIIALGVHPDGDNTTLYLENLLSPILKKHAIKLTKLGRGLSTGTELEYSDMETINAAFLNRK